MLHFSADHLFSTARLPSRMSPEKNVTRCVKHSPRRPQVDSANTRERAPTRLIANETVEDTLRAVRDGNVLTSGEGRRKSKKKNEQVNKATVLTT